MRLGLLLLLSLLTTAPGVSAAELNIVRVWPSYRTAESFVRIAEYFGGAENSDRRIVLRSQPGERAGYYFLVRIANSGAARTGCTWQLQVIMPTARTPRAFTFPAELATGERVFELGLSGTDWPDARTEPVAWLLVLKTADGQELARQQSFLWERPPTPKS
ncbi:MAG: hypothetical protein HZA31_10580 [Opitutae bacterium]|nr:hypothetical protein [Opitutae bacterium]